MNYKQNTPFYIHKFLEYPWKIFESEHYIFHIEEGSLADREIEEIKNRQEAAFSKIIETLDLSLPKRKISYYFYSSQEKKKEFMGDDWYGQSIYNEFIVHAVYNETDKVVGEHEDTHLLSLKLGLPISLFQEGLAEFVVGRSMFGNEHSAVVREGIERGLTINLTSLMSQQGWLDTPDKDAEFYYSIAGSFVAYIYQNFGLETFKKIYSAMDRKNTQEENVRLFESITGQDISFLEAQWRKSIS